MLHIGEVLTPIAGYLIVGILWGCSNPFIKHAQAENTEHGRSDSNKEKSTSFDSLYRMFTKPRVLLPFLVNQSGSFVYYYLLSSEPVSRASPICNSLTFLFTATTGYVCFGEEVRYPFLLVIGIIAVLTGVLICSLD